MMEVIRQGETWEPRLWCDELGSGVRDVGLSLVQ